MPYVLRYVGVATVTDPALAATISTLGLFLRQGGDPTEFWLEGFFFLLHSRASDQALSVIEV